MTYLDELDYKTREFGDLDGELPLWSAPFGLTGRLPPVRAVTTDDLKTPSAQVSPVRAQPRNWRCR